MLGTYSAQPAMPKPGEVTSYQKPHSTGIPLVPNSYVLLRISGTLQAVRNPYLVGTKPGEGAISYTAVEASQATHRGSTFLWLRPSGSAEPPSGGERLSYYFRPDAAARDLVLLVRTGATAAELWAERERLPGAALPGWYCFAPYPYCGNNSAEYALPGNNGGAEKWIEDYWLTQSHTVTATAIAEPLPVAGPDAVPPGATATFTAAPWGDLRLRDKNGSPADVMWVWYPGDTTGTPPPNLSPSIICAGQPRGTCRVKLTGSGRLHIVSHVEGALVEVDRVVRVRQQRLELSCPASVPRGGDARCVAQAVPGGTLDSIRWAFTDSTGAHTTRDSSGAADWKGKMVISGRVSVSARLNGSPVAADTPVTVTARTWPQMTVVAHDSGHGDLPHFPRVMHDLAHTHPPVSASPYDTELIGSGPNTGWWYIRSPITQARAVVHINGGFRPGTPFYQLQRSGVDPVTGQPFCSKGQLAQVERAARRHEGLLASSLTSHVEVYELWFKTHSPQVELERFVTHTTGMPVGNLTFSDLVDNQIAQHISGPAYADPNQRHTTDNPPGMVAFPPVPCRPRF